VHTLIVFSFVWAAVVIAEIYALSLHDALPIYALRLARTNVHSAGLSHCELQQGDMYDLPFAAATFDTVTLDRLLAAAKRPLVARSEEHTSELQSREKLVCRLLLEKKHQFRYLV